MPSAPDKELIRARALELGAYRCGFAIADVVAEPQRRIYAQWIADGKHGTMDYCARYSDVRDDPRLLLPSAQTVISCAFYYDTGVRNPHIATYALGADYHYVLKHRLAQLGDWLVARYGGECRALVDTAPMRERYWAQQAGIGFIGLNNHLIIPGAGSLFFLAELLWTIPLPPDVPNTSACPGESPAMCGEATTVDAAAMRAACEQCRACVRACPNGALDGDGGCDARRCISYLTIEHRGDLPEYLPPIITPTAGLLSNVTYDSHEAQSIVAAPTRITLAGQIYGCDICQRVCPHNRTSQWSTLSTPQSARPESDSHTGSAKTDTQTLEAEAQRAEGAQQAAEAQPTASATTAAAERPAPLPEFAANPEIAALDAATLSQMTPSHYKRLTTKSAMRRAPLPQLLRNIKNYKI